MSLQEVTVYRGVSTKQCDSTDGHEPTHSSIIFCLVDHQSHTGLLPYSAWATEVQSSTCSAKVHAPPAVCLCCLVQSAPLLRLNPVAFPLPSTFNWQWWVLSYGFSLRVTEVDLLGWLDCPSLTLSTFLAYSRFTFFPSACGGCKDKDGHLETVGT